MLQATRWVHRAGLALLLLGVLVPASLGLLPALLLAAASGCLLLVLRGGFVQQCWLQLHLLAALTVMAVVVLAVLPVSREVAGLDAAAAGEPLLARERLWLLVSGGMVLVVGAIGYVKPRLGR